ncbi:MAG: hypothetical protein JXP34_20500, partial [Planctomycetes bacterium]|nr:hypothetical protein [Planctomycetota bacterium]
MDPDDHDPNVGAPEVPVAAPEARRSFTGYALLLIAFVAIAGALHWSWYPIFVDTYYHMATIQGIEQAGGLPTWAFWEMAPAGRVHIYPPAIHIVGYLTTLLGATPVGFITFLSWFLYPAFFFTVWLWMRRVFGARPALIAVVLLCGPGALFWNQTTFNANAFSLTLAPLALLALESEHFLACGALNLLAATAHPMGLFVPAALGINALLRRKKWIAGLLAAGIPVLLYSPWLAHIWANRAFLPDERTGGEVTIGGIGAGSAANIGVAMGACAVLGIIWIAVRRRQALGLLGPLLGFAVVMPMGFGGRFFQFNIHFPLACIGGFGLGMVLERLDRGAAWRRSVVRVFSVGLAFLALSAWAAVDVPLPRELPGPPGGRPRAGGPRAMEGDGPPVRFAVGPTALVNLLDPYADPSPGGGLGPGPGPAARGRARLPGAGVPVRRAGPAGPGGRDMIHREGAREFFDAVGRLVGPGEIIFLPNPMASSLLTGVTGRWTTGGIL